MDQHHTPTRKSIVDQIEQTIIATAEKLDLEAKRLGGGYDYLFTDFYDKNLGLLLRVYLAVDSRQELGFLASTACYPVTNLVASSGDSKTTDIGPNGPGKAELDRIASFVESWARQCLLERLERLNGLNDELRDELDPSERG